MNIYGTFLSLINCDLCNSACALNLVHGFQSKCSFPSLSLEFGCHHLNGTVWIICIWHNSTNNKLQLLEIKIEIFKYWLAIFSPSLHGSSLWRNLSSLPQIPSVYSRIRRKLNALFNKVESFHVFSPLFVMTIQITAELFF